MLKEKNKNDYQKVIRTITSFQIYNQLIVGVFKRHALKEFSAETRDYLRASVTLHPLIRGETEDWGHPDAAILIYADDPPGREVDSNYFTFAGLQSDLPKVWWLELESEKKVSEAPLQLPLSKSARRKQERKENPDLRLKLKAEAEKYKNNASVFSKTSPLATEAKPAEAFEVALRIEPKSAEAAVVIPSSIAPSRIELEPATSSEDKDKKKPSKKGAKRRARYATKAEEKPSVKEDAEKSSEEPICAPGNRKFHPSAVKSVKKLELSASDQATVDTIFSSDRFQRVSYREFKTLWIRINGEKSIQKPGSGGSHRSLRNRDGKVVGSTYAPNKNHTYGLQTIKYLRDALRAVGAHPSK